MKSTIKRYPNDVKDWWNKVLDDIKWAENDFTTGFYTQTCFITQQIVEKALKTFLLDRNQIVQKIHKLPVLLDRCIKIDSGFKKFITHIKDLDQYYISTRYPPSFGGAKGDYTKEEAKNALNLTKEIVAFVEKKIRT